MARVAERRGTTHPALPDAQVPLRSGGFSAAFVRSTHRSETLGPSRAKKPRLLSPQPANERPSQIDASSHQDRPRFHTRYGCLPLSTHPPRVTFLILTSTTVSVRTTFPLVFYSISTIMFVAGAASPFFCNNDTLPPPRLTASPRHQLSQHHRVYGLEHLAARGKSPDRPCARDLASAGKARGGGDGRASSTTSNAVRRRQTPGALRVVGGADPSALLRLLDDAWASPASPRLVSGPTAPATRPIRLLPRAAKSTPSEVIADSRWHNLLVDKRIDLDSMELRIPSAPRLLLGATALGVIALRSRMLLLPCCRPLL